MTGGFKKIASCRIIPHKWFFTIMAFSAIFNSFTMRSCLTVAITSMVVLEVSEDAEDVDPSACQYKANATKTTEVDSEGRYAWSQSQQGFVLGAYYIGYALTNIPGAILADIYGAKIVQAAGAFIYAGLTVFTPQIIQYGGVYALSAARIGEGLADGVTFPCINIMVSDWIPPHQKSSLGAMIFSGCLLGSVTGSTLSGSIIATFNNWELVFYFFGSITFIWFVLWMMFIYNSPFTHPYISEKEMEVYRSNLGEGDPDEEPPPVPWKSMFTSVPLWALLTAQIGSIWLFSIIGSTLAKYLNDVLRFSVAEVGLYSGLPFLFMWISSSITGYVVDIFVAEGKLTTTYARKICVTSASFLPGIFILVASYCGCHRNYAVVFFSVAMGCMGPYFPGIKVNPLDLSPNYSGLIMAIINATGAVISVITPVFVTWMTPNATIHEWRNVFWITFFILIFTGSVFSIFASGEIQDWNYGKNSHEDFQGPSTAHNKDDQQKIYVART